RVRPREINVFEDARSRRHRRGGVLWLCAPLRGHPKLPRPGVAPGFFAPDVARARLPCPGWGNVARAADPRPGAPPDARANKLLIGEADEGVGAFELAQALDEAVDEAIAARARHEMQDDLGIGR